jgi:FdhD protein
MKSTQKRAIILVNTVREDSCGEGGKNIEDTLSVEEPLEIIIGYGAANHRQRKTIAVTMRTPDNDFELAIGFLFTEGVIFNKKDVKIVRFTDENRVLVDLDEKVNFDFEKLNRNFYTTSSCGVCGKASLEAISKTICYILEKGVPIVSKDILFRLPAKLLAVQQSFIETGGAHASVLFNTEGVLLKIFEDVGRHNALDKLIGWAFQQDILPLKESILLVSGRASFELIQKASMAGISIVVAVGAPSSLAVDLAHENGITLIGFLKKETFNIYTGLERVQL